MSASFDRLAFEQQAPFLGHPFGGLIREDRFGALADLDHPVPPLASEADTSSALDDAGGFDFHLGVYSRF
ncbi:MAG: hypothetical protein WDN31_15310 [Hyphomicrobium sp.]